MLVPAATGSERTLAPGVDVVLEVVRMGVNEQFSTLMPTLYPGSTATVRKPYASLDAMWKAFSNSVHNKTPAVNGEKCFGLRIYSPGAWSSAQSCPGPPVMSAAKSECHPSRLLSRRRRAIIRLFFLSMIPLTLGFIKRPTAAL